MATLMDYLVFIFFLFQSISFRVYCFSAADINELLSRKGYDFKDVMRRQLGGPFTVGINDPKSKTGEFPIRETEVKPFYMDVYPVTNAQFWRYIMHKPRYRTTAQSAGYSMVIEHLLGRHVRRKWTTETENQPWWLKVTGAQWDRPEGPGTNVRDRLNHPVVHVSYLDAKAYCMFIGKRLPTEEEWEFAARAELKGKQYPWGDKFEKNRMNTWQGTFPDDDNGADGYKGLSPVNAFRAQNNATGLTIAPVVNTMFDTSHIQQCMFDMLGNAWEWTTTKYYQRGQDRLKQPLRYVLKGGSFMDSRDGSANQAVRTASRMGQEPHYTAINVGFRCAASAPQLVKKMREQDPRYNKKTTTKRPPRLHRYEEMDLSAMKRTRGNRAQMKAFVARSGRENIQRTKRVLPVRNAGMRREEL